MRSWLAVLVLSMSVLTPEMPPLSPDFAHEVRVEATPDFERECDARLRSVVTGPEYALLSQVATRSPKWGMVLRRDYSIAGLEGGDLVNRVVCWRTGRGDLSLAYAWGQESLLPLTATENR